MSQVVEHLPSKHKNPGYKTKYHTQKVSKGKEKWIFYRAS
jgi:hypothetical protein